MKREIVKVQLPVAGGWYAALIYNESREFEVIVDDAESFRNIGRAQDNAVKAYWNADLDYTLRTFKLIDRAPDQDW